MTGSFEDDKSNPLEGLSTDFASLLQTVARHDAAFLPMLGTVVGNKYEIIGILGQGGMGVVYAARHRLTGKLFAIKWLLPDLSARRDAVERFIREAIAAGKVEHPNVVEIYDVDQHETSHYMVMQLVHGETLAQRLAQRTRLGHVESCRILIQVMRGLAAVHAEGIIHRDLKPHNIIIARTKQGEEQPKVLDFGISKIMPKLDELSIETRSGNVMMGTPCYMAPEQLRSNPVDPRTDVYALGVIAYQTISGTLPFSADNIPDLICKVMGDRPPLLTEMVRDVPVELSQVIAKALSLQPSERFDSVESLAVALEPFAGGTSFKTDRLAEISEETPDLTVSTTSLLATESRGIATGASTRRLHIARGWLVTGVALVISLVVIVVIATQRSKRGAGSAPPQAASAPMSPLHMEPTTPPTAAEPAAVEAVIEAPPPAANVERASSKSVARPTGKRATSAVRQVTQPSKAPETQKAQRITGGDMDESDNE